MEDETGRLAVGMRADLTVLDGDPLTVDAGALSALKVVRTVVGGRTTYQAPSP
jgi:predicted amidohydrolase YtcJ